jgi:hypothetical protein
LRTSRANDANSFDGHQEPPWHDRRRARIQAYLDDLIEGSPTLLPYRYALVDVVALKTDSRVEIYEEGGAGKDTASMWLPEGATVKPNTVSIVWLPDSRSAALKPYDSGEWQWTRQQPAGCPSAV